jgi:putative phage structural protein|nr:MAG TPA: structural protein [Caudoviricetes sp.]
MASIFDRYGIKEVADVTFYKINSDGSRGMPVLYLDTLKVSTVEQTASSADARGGKGNPKLVSWDFGKEINVTLTDALFSPASMALMFGDKDGVGTENTEKITKVAMTRILKTAADSTIEMDTAKGRETVKVLADGEGAAAYNTGITKVTDADGVEVAAADFGSKTAGEKFFVHYEVTPTSKKVIDINADTFPGTYYITGDTFCRSDVTGEDDFFQFIIPKAKMSSENTITLEAEGDPSVFNLNLTVLRPESGPMMQLVQYNL